MAIFRLFPFRMSDGSVIRSPATAESVIPIVSPVMAELVVPTTSPVTAELVVPR